MRKFVTRTGDKHEVLRDAVEVRQLLYQLGRELAMHKNEVDPQLGVPNNNSSDAS